MPRAKGTGATPAQLRSLKKARAAKKRKAQMKAEGIVDWVKGAYNTGKNIYNKGKSVYDTLSKNKYISRAADFADSFGVPYASNVSQLAKKAGLGKGRRRKAGGPRTKLDLGMLP